MAKSGKPDFAWGQGWGEGAPAFPYPHRVAAFRGHLQEIMLKANAASIIRGAVTIL